MHRTLLPCCFLACAVYWAGPANAQAVANGESKGPSAADASQVSEREAETVSPSSIEFVQRIVAEGTEANDQFLQLPQVSPRGADDASRREMVRLLIPLLESGHPDIRARTAAAIGLFGEDARDAIPHLLELIGDPEKTVELTSVWTVVSKALQKVGVASIEPAMEKIKSAEGWEFVGITSVIASLGDEEEARGTVPYFLEQLKNGPDQYKWSIMYCLSRMGPAAQPAIPEYIKFLDHEEFNMQVIACRALAELGEASKDAVPRLILLTRKEGNLLSTRTHAAMCLGAIGPTENGLDLVELFTSMVSENNAFSQERGLIALGRLGNNAAHATSYVAALLDNPEFSQRPEAALTLWQISNDAQRSLDILQPMMNDPTYDHRVRNALKTMGPAAAPLANVLVESLHTEDASLQLEIAEVLQAMGKSALPFVDQLRSLPETAPPDIGVRLDEIIVQLDELRETLEQETAS